MPAPGSADLANELREAIATYLWKQWRAVGAMSSEPPARIIVDPEALILMSLWMVTREQRLSDLLWSWIEVNSSLVSIRRLGNLAERFPDRVQRLLGALADGRIQEKKDGRWKSLRSKPDGAFHHRASKTRAAPPQFVSSATLTLQLRLGLGVGVKADVLTLLLGTNVGRQEWSSVSTIADALGYTVAATRRAADDLARAKFILALETGEQRAQRMFSAQPSS